MDAKGYIIRKAAVLCAVMLVLVLCLAVSLFAEEATEKKGPEIVMKEVTGEVSAIDKHCIAIVYKRDETGEYELPLTIQEPPSVERIKGFDKIKMGDTVTVKYAQMTEIRADGKEIIGDKFAKTIIFVKPAPPPQPEKEETERMDSGEAEQQ